MDTERLREEIESKSTSDGGCPHCGYDAWAEGVVDFRVQTSIKTTRQTLVLTCGHCGYMRFHASPEDRGP